METIIYAHPWQGSFNHALLESLEHHLHVHQTPYQIIDLYQDGFNPAFSEQELAHFKDGAPIDPLVTKYQHMLTSSDGLTFIFPIWWSSMPAIVKGFFDKVMLPGFGYDEKNGWQGKLTWIKHVNILTSSESNRNELKTIKGNAIQTWFVDTVLQDIGINRNEVVCKHFGSMHH